MNKLIVVIVLIVASVLSSKLKVGADGIPDDALRVERTNTMGSPGMRVRQNEIGTLGQNSAQDSRQMRQNPASQRSRLRNLDQNRNIITATTRADEVGRRVQVQDREYSDIENDTIGDFSADNSPEKSSTENKDNTRINEQDRDQRTLTPMDQGSSASDRNLAAAIRNEIVNNEQMSTYGRNIKIIVRDGNVFLRGPVQTHIEAQAIEKIAERHASGASVESKIEVASNE